MSEGLDLQHIGLTATRHGLAVRQYSSLCFWMRDAGRAWLHHGCCVGGDEQAHRLALVEDWNTTGHPGIGPAHLRGDCRDLTEIRRAAPYLARNRDIVDETIRLLGCPRETAEQARGGTWSTIRYARSLGRPVTMIWPDGSVTENGVTLDFRAYRQGTSRAAMARLVAGP